MEQANKNKTLLKLLVWGGFIVSFLWLCKAFALGLYPDFVTQYIVPKIVFSGGNPYLGGDGLFTPQVYPPTTFLFFVPFTYLPIGIASFLYTFLSVVSLIVSLFLLSKIVGERFLSMQNLGLMTLAFIYFPVKFTLGMGQINLYILLLLVLSLLYLKKNREFISGIFLGLSIVIKLFPIFLPLYFFIKAKRLPHEYQDKFHWSGFFNVRIFNRKLWIWPSQVNENLRLILGIVTAIFVSLFLVAILIPWELIVHFVVNVMPSLSSSWKLDYYNQALSGWVGRSFGTEVLGSGVKLLLTGLISIMTIFAVSKNEKYDFLTVGLKFGSFIVLSLIINTFSWQHHFVWLIIPFYITYFYLKERIAGKRYFVILFAAYFLTAINFENPDMLPVLLQSHGLYGALLLLFLNIRILFLKEKQ